MHNLASNNKHSHGVEGSETEDTCLLQCFACSPPGSVCLCYGQCVMPACESKLASRSNRKATVAMAVFVE